MRRLVRRPQLVSILLVALVAIGTSLPRVELCVGPDGHVAIEPVGASCCGEAGGDAFLGADGHCAAGCVDTPLQISVASPSSDRQHGAPLAVAVVGAPPDLGHDHAHCSARHGMSAPPLAPPRALRTTVFLC